MKTQWPLRYALSLLIPVALSIIAYRLDSFDPAPLPGSELTRKATAAPRINHRMLQGSELIGSGQLTAPEDIAFDPIKGFIYTGCADGWLKRVKLSDSAQDSVVVNWVNTGGRPLGVALGLNEEIIVADAYKGLLKVSGDSKVEVLTDEAEGVKFRLTDGVDVAKDGMIYFTDASFKYTLAEFIFDILEGKPHGRFMSFDPVTKETKVLARDLYFANGVTVSHDQKSVIFCETSMRRCRKYVREGEDKGSIREFVENLPGVPDNIRYDGEGQYWIAFATSVTPLWKATLRYPFLRKILAMVEKNIGAMKMEKDGGVMAFDIGGNATAHYFDKKLSLITGCSKIGQHLYCGSLQYPYILRLNLTQNPAV